MTCPKVMGLPPRTAKSRRMVTYFHGRPDDAEIHAAKGVWSKDTIFSWCRGATSIAKA